MKSTIYLFLMLGLLLGYTACNEEESNPVNELSNLNLITSEDLNQLDLTIQVYSENQQLYTGYNKMVFRVLQSGTTDIYHDASIALSSMMDMGDMMHASPVEQPAFLVDKYWHEGAVVFVMPSTAGDWTISVTVKDELMNKSASIQLPVTVAMPDEPRMISFTHEDEHYFISMIEPSKPVVGINYFELAVHRKESMMSWPYVEHFEFTISPEMPTMGHGSPNNEDPTHTNAGHYLGKVNFTMDGYWTVNLGVMIDGKEVMEDLAFDITFSARSNE